MSNQTTPAAIQRVYLLLLLLNTLAASFIWGINTLFLLDAGLNNIQAFAANAFFTVGQVIFEVPTGVIADTWGRRASYLLGAATLALATILYWLAWQWHTPFWTWAATSILLGLGFTFFSGATEAWLVDALRFTKFKGELEEVFAKGQIVSGVAMLTGSVGGGLLAQSTNLGVPYVLRSIMLGLTFVIAWVYMKDLGFKPDSHANLQVHLSHLFKTSWKNGLGNPAVRWVMLAAPFTMGVGFYAFYAMQPFLLQLYGNPNAYGIAGLAAALVAGAQIVGGLLVPHLAGTFKRRTTILITSLMVGIVLLLGLGLVKDFWLAVVLLAAWSLVGALSIPVRQAYLNGLIPTNQRATVLSFDSLVGSSGGIVVQPILGRVADIWGYAASYVIGALIEVFALPFMWLARRSGAASDTVSPLKSKTGR